VLLQCVAVSSQRVLSTCVCVYMCVCVCVFVCVHVHTECLRHGT